MDQNFSHAFDLQSRDRYSPGAGFSSPSGHFQSQRPTLQPLPPYLQHIHNDLQTTICVPYTANWFSDFVTDVSHDIATRRVAVASSVPYIPLPSFGSKSESQDPSSLLSPNQAHFNTQTLLDQFAQFQLSSQQQQQQQQNYHLHPRDSLDNSQEDENPVLITTPQPTITIFEHSNNEWRVQSILPHAHVGNIYKIDWCDPEFGTFVAACSDDGLVHVYEEVILDQQMTSIINDNQLLSETNLIHPLHKHITAIQANQTTPATGGESTFHTSTTPFLTPHQYQNASTLQNGSGNSNNNTSALNNGKKKDDLRAQLASSQQHPLIPTPSALLQQSINPQPTTAISSSVPSVLQHPITKPPSTTWIRTCSFQTGLDPIVYLEWAPRHIGMRLATCCLDGKLRIYDLQTNDEHELVVADYDCTACSWNRSPWDTPMLLTVGDMYAQIYEYSDKGSRWYRQCVLPGHVDTLTTCAWAPSYGRTFHIIATGDRSGIVRIFKLFPRGFDGTGMTGAAAELLSLLIPYQYKNFHFQTHNNFGTVQLPLQSFHQSSENCASIHNNNSDNQASNPIHTDGDDSNEMKLLYRGYKDKLTSVSLHSNNREGFNNDDQFVLDSFLGAGFSISRLSFDPTGQLLSVVDDSGATTVFMARDDGFWAPYYTPTVDDIIDEYKLQSIQDVDINPYQFLLQQQQLKKSHEDKFVQSLQPQHQLQHPQHSQHPQQQQNFQHQHYNSVGGLHHK